MKSLLNFESDNEVLSVRMYIFRLYWSLFPQLSTNMLKFAILKTIIVQFLLYKFDFEGHFVYLKQSAEAFKTPNIIFQPYIMFGTKINQESF